MLSESSELSQLSELIELPEVFSSTEKCLLHQALRPGDPLIKLLELRFVSSSSETSRSSGTIQTSQSSISSHPAFPDVVNDHSTGLYSLNSLIPADGGFIKLDNVSDLVTNICAMMAQNGGQCPAWLWKSDASQAYHQLPMHP